MIRDQCQIVINAPREEVFNVIEKMPNKFPTYAFLSAKPFLFIRLLLVDGFKSALEIVSVKIPAEGVYFMRPGESMGPFRLTTVEKPSKYWFTLKSLFFDCQTGYTLMESGKQTELVFFLVSQNPTLGEKTYWWFVKGVHSVLANKVLKVIKTKVEHQQYSQIVN